MKKIKCVVKKHNIIVKDRTLRYDDTMIVDDIFIHEIENLINAGYIIVEELSKQELSTTINDIQQNTIIPKIQINKNELIEIIFKFHTSKELSQDELKKLIWFYTTIHPINHLGDSVKNDMDYINNHEELIEILINQMYPKLIDLYLNN